MARLTTRRETFEDTITRTSSSSDITIPVKMRESCTSTTSTATTVASNSSSCMMSTSISSINTATSVIDMTTTSPIIEAIDIEDDENDDMYPQTLQEELNEIVEAFYDAVSEEDIRTYQNFIEGIMESRIAEHALGVGHQAPNFTLKDQDDDLVSLQTLLQTGPVVLVFYRGKWCPHCQATIMRFQRHLDEIKATGANLVAISPMLPDGTQYLATKRCLEFSVCSDIGNQVAKLYNLVFTVDPKYRDTFVEWGDDLPHHNGREAAWDIPLPATYIINQDGQIVWSFVDNDTGVRAEPSDIIAAIPRPSTNNIIIQKVGDKKCSNNSNTTTKTMLVQEVCEDSAEFTTTTTTSTSSAYFTKIFGGVGRHQRKKTRPRQQLQNPEETGDIINIDEIAAEVNIQNSDQQQEDVKKQRALSVTFRRSIKKVFGKRRQSAPDFLGNYLG